MAYKQSIDPVIAALFEDSRRDAERRSSDRKRTTLHAPASDIRTLRQLALQCDCTMNDLIALAIADLISTVGLVPTVSIKGDLHEKLQGIHKNSST